MSVEIIAGPSPTIIQSADAIVNCDVSEGHVEVVLGYCSGHSISGVVVRKIGRTNDVYITAERGRDVKLYDGKKYVMMLIVKRWKVRDLTFTYEPQTKTWTMVRSK